MLHNIRLQVTSTQSKEYWLSSAVRQNGEVAGNCWTDSVGIPELRYSMKTRLNLLGLHL